MDRIPYLFIVTKEKNTILVLYLILLISLLNTEAEKILP